MAEEPAPVVPLLRRRERRTWLVHQLVAEARELIEAELGDVWVEGEISNLRPASSGHLYFTLKDAEAQLPVVLFRRQAMLLRFRPEDGLQVRVRGKCSIYEQRGQLQLVAETMEPVGSGSLQLAFEQLRDRLKAEGLFNSERKRQLPLYPRTVAIVTSPTGAVIRDFLSVVGRRHVGLNVTLIPSAVQGENAVGELVAGIALANGLSVDLIVLARGGGSLEDLAAFNSEPVARAIVASRLPIVSAIGHETDFTIADFVADLRAPTPSAAAELITEAQHQVTEMVARLEHRLERGIRYQLLQARQRLSRVPFSYAEQRITTRLHRLEQRLDDAAFRLEAAVSDRLKRQRDHVTELRTAILQRDPRQRLSLIQRTVAANVVRMEHALERQLTAARFRMNALDMRFSRAAHVGITEQRSAWREVHRELHALSPLAVLHRGYALVLNQSGKVVRSTAELTPNQTVETRLGDGSFQSSVTDIQKSEKDTSTSA